MKYINRRKNKTQLNPFPHPQSSRQETIINMFHIFANWVSLQLVKNKDSTFRLKSPTFFIGLTEFNLINQKKRIRISKISRKKKKTIEKKEKSIVNVNKNSKTPNESKL